MIGYIPQDVFLFSDSIANNIAFGSKDISQEKILQSAKDADLYDNVMGFPEQFETVLGERGITLSGGQKQRMSIARAIITDPKIIILDDATSALDTETDAQIKNALRDRLKGCTSIIISHRISSIQNCDRIYYLEAGRIVEHGTHNALATTGGPYAELNRLQSLEHELDEA